MTMAFNVNFHSLLLYPLSNLDSCRDLQTYHEYFSTVIQVVIAGMSPFFSFSLAIKFIAVLVV
jgi:hypothetical protein